MIPVECSSRRWSGGSAFRMSEPMAFVGLDLRQPDALLNGRIRAACQERSFASTAKCRIKRNLISKID